ncbi:hypothetical protein M0R72_01655 [Candidatus Pacearchaeota archaeon]|jgi:hypothetical protein|nr:hypothetical protein [Candidatus Pacearchaeota archaeon]
MASHTDNAVASTEQDMGEKSHRGPRAKFFFCISWKTKQFGPVEATTADEAREIWGKAHPNDKGEPVPPNVCDSGDGLKDIGGGSGYYLAKGTGMGDAQRISVTVSAAQMTRYTKTHVKAEFHGWIVYGNGIKGFKSESDEYEDDELAMIMFDSPINPDNKIPKPKLKKNEAVRMADLKIVSQCD